MSVVACLLANSRLTQPHPRLVSPHTHVHRHTHTHTCMHTCARTLTRTLSRKKLYTHTVTNAHSLERKLDTHQRTLYTHTHTHTHTHTQRQRQTHTLQGKATNRQKHTHARTLHFYVVALLQLNHSGQTTFVFWKNASYVGTCFEFSWCTQG